MDGLVTWLKELAVFIVICETILSFAPNGVYKRYIKPFVGLIILLRISAFMVGATEVDWNKRIDDVFEGYEQSVSRYLENITIVEPKDSDKEGVQEEEMTNIDILKQDLITVDEVVIPPIGRGE